MAMIRPEIEMKDSGIEWIGNIPNDWNIRRLKYVLNERKEKNDPLVTDNILSLSAEQGVIPFSERIGGGNKPKEDLTAYKVVRAGDIVLNSMNVLSGAVHYSNHTGCVSPVYYMLYNENDIITRYYNLVFQTEAFQRSLRGLGNGILIKETDEGKLNTIRMRIPMEKLSKVELPFPSIDEMKMIVESTEPIRSKIDEIIAEAKASIDEYKELRESVISNATTRGIKKNRCMKSSGVEWLPEIPADWNVLSPKVVFTQRKDRAIKGERQLTASQKHGIMYQDDYMKEEGVRIVTVEKDFSILKHVEPDDFVISMRSFQGGLEYSYLRGCISSAYVMLIPNHKYVYSEYYKWFFKSDKYINALQSTSDLIRDGQALRYANFVKLKLFDIPIKEQKEIADYLNKEVPKIDSLIAEKESLINDLEAYKKSLIYEVVTGKRRVV